MLIIPAASALPKTYETVVKAVSAHGYSIEALHIPSVGLETGDGAREGEPPTMYDDAKFIAARVAGLADAGNDVLLITHSYGGVPATEVVRGLSKAERGKHGKEGGIVGLAYMTSLVPEVGMPALTTSPAPLMVVGVSCSLRYTDVDMNKIRQANGRHRMTAGSTTRTSHS